MARRKVLMITNAEHGHSNIFLSAAFSLLERDPSLELHFATFPSLKPTFDSALAHSKKDVEPVFHSLPGPVLIETCNRHPDPMKRMEVISMLKPGFWNTPTVVRFFLCFLFKAWTPKEYGALFKRICEIIESVEADVVVIDPLMGPGMTAAKYLHARHEKPRFKLAILSPNSVKEFTMQFARPWDTIAKWPCPNSVMPIPLPWYLIPLNIYFLICLVISIITDREQVPYEAAVRAETGVSDLQLVSYLTIIDDGLDRFDCALVNSNAAVDYPGLDLSTVPLKFLDKLIPCGPITRAEKPLAEVDQELLSWIKKGSLLYINLGTICPTSEDEAVEMAHALRYVLDRERAVGKQDLLILWKLKKDPKRGPKYETGKGSRVYDVLKDAMDADRIRIVDWLKAEPSSLLDSGEVSCAMTHGGASSYFEAAVAGVPQIVIPVWADTFDYANRAEMHGIGRWGNRRAYPRWSASELGPILEEVLLDRHEEFAGKARMLAETCRKYGEGRDIAARKIIELADGRA